MLPVIGIIFILAALIIAGYVAFGNKKIKLGEKPGNSNQNTPG